MENHRGPNNQLSRQIASEPGTAMTLFKTILLHILGFVTYSQAVPFLWLVLGSILFIIFSFAPESTGMVLVLTLRLLMIEKPNSAFEENLDPEIFLTAFGRLFLLFTMLLYLSGLVLNQLGIHLLRSFRRKVIALVALCLAVFFILNLCYAIAATPFNGPRSHWLLLFSIHTIALFLTGIWAIGVQEAAQMFEKALFPPASIQKRV